ncbi:MAG: GNAT family N-acetyltransferase [Erysipelothrix sp.]
MNQVIIRKAIKDDAPEIHELLKVIADFHHDMYPDRFEEGHVKYSLPEVENLTEDEEYFINVAIVDECVAGYVIGITRNKVFFIDDLCVGEAYRNHKIGKVLMDSVYQEAQLKKFDEIQLNVWNRNIQAMAFYEKLGYESLKQVLTLKITES